MNLTIDHILVLVRDLTVASRDFALAGFTVTPGGVHADGATHNALIAFADGAYFELIAPTRSDRRPDDEFVRWLQRGEGLVHYALRTGDLGAEAARLRSAGMPISGPEEGGRERPDGQRVQWRTLAVHPGDETLPFLIADVTPRSLRVPGEEAARHALGITRLVGLTVVVADLAESTRALGSLLGHAGQALDLPGGDPAVQFALGPQWVLLAQPGADGSPLQRQLDTWGEGPYEVTLSAGPDAVPGAGTALPADRLHGARLRVVR
jgi:glyoxalase-like protein